MRIRRSLLALAAAALLGLALAPDAARASVDCPCWDELPPGIFLLCYENQGPGINTWGYAPPGFFLQVTDLYCRINGQFTFLKSGEEAFDCRWHLLEACFPELLGDDT